MSINLFIFLLCFSEDGKHLITICIHPISSFHADIYVHTIWNRFVPKCLLLSHILYIKFYFPIDFYFKCSVGFQWSVRSVTVHWDMFSITPLDWLRSFEFRKAGYLKSCNFASSGNVNWIFLDSEIYKRNNWCHFVL